MTESACRYGECDGSGMLLDEETNTAYRCRCSSDRLRRRRLHRALRGIPEGFHFVSWEREPIVHSNVRPELQAYVNRFDANLEAGRGLWLYGETGVGKTYAAALITKEVNDVASCAIWNGQRLLSRIKQLIRPDAPISTFEFVDQLLEVDLLVIDDIGAINATDYALEQIYTIVNDRYEHKRPLIITSDLTVFELETRFGSYGPRIVRRLGEICGAPLEMKLPGADLRAVK